jgi:hypothetical protein
MIKVYTDLSFITPEYRKMIFPLLFDLCYSTSVSLLELYQIVNNVNEADIVIVPVDIAYFFENDKRQWLYDFIAKGNASNKPVWVYSAGDRGISLSADVYTFRLSGFHNKLNEKTFILPSFIIDPLIILKKEFKPIPKPILPSIGFVGHANGSAIKWFKEFSAFLYHNLKRTGKLILDDYQSFYPSSIKRYQFLMILKENDQIKTDFIFRKKYRAGVKNEEEKIKTSFEFFENIFGNPYVFCPRGAGNFSVRFYETLAMGRIPVIIDTDIRLPLGEVVNWNNHCIIATENNFANKLIDFHSTINEHDFEQMQVNNRNLWLDHLNRDTYFSHIYSTFKDEIK